MCRVGLFSLTVGLKTEMHPGVVAHVVITTLRGEGGAARGQGFLRWVHSKLYMRPCLNKIK